MAFSYTVETPPGKLTGNSKLHGNYELLAGTWTAGTATTGEIKTGLSYVYAGGTTVSAGTITAEHTSLKNTDGAAGASAGSIGIVVCAANNVGSWFAIGYV